MLFSSMARQPDLLPVIKKKPHKQKQVPWTWDFFPIICPTTRARSNWPPLCGSVSMITWGGDANADTLSTTSPIRANGPLLLMRCLCLLPPSMKTVAGWISLQASKDLRSFTVLDRMIQFLRETLCFNDCLWEIRVKRQVKLQSRW